MDPSSFFAAVVLFVRTVVNVFVALAVVIGSLLAGCSLEVGGTGVAADAQSKADVLVRADGGSFEDVTEADATLDVMDAAEEPPSCDLDRDGHPAWSCGGDDCCDQDPSVFPGQTAYFEVQSACKSFDYDCNGMEVPETPVVACALDWFQCTGSGFVSSTLCGVEATYRVCKYAVLSCATSEEPRRQRCH
ncbi:MAG: hypothetical protein WCI05_11795 [Myxococcales bacterium]|jgi:hypothetical protein